ncbi:MAG TPA: carboxypeptidase-like regulatory domain-containing protein [Candidatus Sulfotelmatobacter sp.]|nr:carboxypeptidase-like regulatory domain-containing protein [Candidatus Sulfotelmatobacter sp.]
MRTFLSSSLLVACLVLGIGICADAQTGQISGQVTDQTGAALPKAGVRAINDATAVERHTQTNDAGLYTFSFLAPGTYQVVIEAPGFSTVMSDKLTVTVAQALVFNVQLKVGHTQQEITVQAESQGIDTTDAQVSNVIDEHQIETLPNILRDPYQLVLLSSGVNPTNNSDGGFSVNGGRETANHFLLDGGENNDVEFSVGSVTAINPDSAQEFRVLTNNFMPEYGRSDGAVINVITKSGSNQFHGEVHEFGRWDVLGARDYFNHQIDPLTGKVGRKNPYIRNLFGASLGGPIVKDKTFFFFNYEGNRFDTTLSQEFTVPTAQLLSGKFTYNGVTPLNQPISVPVDVRSPTSADNHFGLSLDPLVKKIFSFYPTPNLVASNGILGEAFVPQVQLSNGDSYTVKIDHAFSSSENFSGRYILSNGLSTNDAFNEVVPGLGGLSGPSRSQSLALSLVSAFNYKWQNYFIANAKRLTSPAQCTGLKTLNSIGLPDSFGDTQDMFWPNSIAGWGCTLFGDGDGQSQASGSYDFSDHVTYTAGRHTIKFGGQVDDLYSNNTLGFGTRGALDYGDFASFFAAADQSSAASSLGFNDQLTLQESLWMLFGQAAFQFQSQYFTPSKVRLHTDAVSMRAHDFSFFGQDSFRLSPKLTLNYGVLWEFNGVPYEAGNRLSTVPVAQLSGPAPITFQNVGQNGAYLFHRDWLTPQPRFGFAWDPFGDGKTSIRGGIGLFSDRAFFLVADSVRGNPPFTNSFFLPIPSFTSNGFAPGTPASVLAPQPTVTPSPVVAPFSFFRPSVVNQNLRLPYSENWNFGIQRQLPGNVMLEINYVGVMGRKLLRNLDGNQPIPSKVAALRAFCADPTYSQRLQTNPTNPGPNPNNALGCIDSPIARSQDETVQGFNLYDGGDLGILPFDAVNNNALFHATVLEDEASSSYNGLQATVTKKFTHGLYFQGAYTWSHIIDDAAFPFNAIAGQAELPTNSFNLRADRGSGSYDIRQVFVMNYIWDLPFGRQRAFLNRGLVGKALEGWSISGITDFSGGFPFDVFSQIDTSGTGGDPVRADFNPHGTPVPVANPRTQLTPNPGFFSNPPFGRGGNLGRDSFRAPGINNWDMVLSKNTRLNDRLNLEFRAECYNLFNRVQFAPPPSFIDFVGTSFLGQSLNQEGRADLTTGSRQFQFALKLKF